LSLIDPVGATMSKRAGSANNMRVTFCRPYGTRLASHAYPGFRSHKSLATSGANVCRPSPTPPRARTARGGDLGSGALMAANLRPRAQMQCRAWAPV
ncbi:MAG: hypothetical protein ABSD20_12605, partial [Terriglobales bacterium]